MAEELGKKREWSRRPRPTKYPYTTWANGNVWRAVRGVDYTITSVGMSSSLRNWGRRRGLAVRYETTEDDIIFQFVPARKKSKLDAEVVPLERHRRDKKKPVRRKKQPG